MTPEKYKEFLLSRILVRNGFGTMEKLLAAIDKANAIIEWSNMKREFNKISEQAPMHVGGKDFYCITYPDIPEFLDSETEAFMDFQLKSAPTSPEIH